ncbi:PspC domain-containing protein [Paenibacillus sp. DMB5]|uniref:PspC domain-containing protein n=1 Tax=Paenibacillus sp. DMB5 TaxID=1780103 RepID=UPI000A8D6418
MTRLYRSTRDKVMTGLAGGLSETLGIDSTLFRILLLVSIPFTGGATILVYFIAALIIPKEPTQYNPFGPGPGAPGGPYGGHYGGPGYGSGPQGRMHRAATADLADSPATTRTRDITKLIVIPARIPAWMR